MDYTEEQKQGFKEEFSRRKRLQLMVSLPFVVVLAGLFILGDQGSSGALGVPIELLGGVLAVLLVGVLIFSLKNWRCPACNAYLGKGMGHSFCPKCGVALR